MSGRSPTDRSRRRTRVTLVLVQFVLAPAVSLGVIWFAWWALVTWLHVPGYLASTPADAFDAITQRWSLLSPLVWATATETVYGLLVGVGSGVLFAVVMSRLRVLEILLYPPIITSQAIPIIALAPILVLVFGYTLTPIIIVVALFVFFPITINTLAALNAVDHDLLDLTRVLGASRWRRFAHVEVPSALPGFFSGLRIGSVYAVSGAIISQLYDNYNGTSLALNQQNEITDFKIPAAYGDTIVMTVLSLLLFLIVAGVGYVATPWLHRDVAPRWTRAGRTESVE